MKLRDLDSYQNIVIQMHDNPDADALGSGYGLYLYFKEKGKNVRLVYGGKYRIRKCNLVLMVSMLEIPVEYVETLEPPELLITVDCQYGEGNVTKFSAHRVAVIDHHQISGRLPELSEVRSNLGACASLVRHMLVEEGYDYNRNRHLATALYYGLMTDTSNFAEISHPLDRDLQDYADFEKTAVTRFVNSNLSLDEIEIAGNALIHYQYFDTYRYATVQAESCDPNILGMISDMVLEVDVIDTCLVYSLMPFGIKISVRSCVREVRANELARYITDGIGSGGGHVVKAGGFIKRERMEELCRKKGVTPDEQGVQQILNDRMNCYFKDTEVIHAADYKVDVSEMQLYEKKKLSLGYVESAKLFPCGTKICIRTLETDLDVETAEDVYIMIGLKGEVYPIQKDKFEKKYSRRDEPYEFHGEYEPAVMNLAEGKNLSVLPYAKSCVSEGENTVYAKQLNHCVKVFTEWDPEKYMLGEKGDYLAASPSDLHDMYIVNGDIFRMAYRKI